MNQYLKDNLHLDIKSIELFLETWASSYSLAAYFRIFGFNSEGKHLTNPEFDSFNPTELMIAKHNLIAYLVLLRLYLKLNKEKEPERSVALETEKNLLRIYQQLPEFAKF